MARGPRDLYALGQVTERRTPGRPVPKVVRIPPPQLFRCPRCSAMSFQVLFHERDVAGSCAEWNFRLRTDKTICRRAPVFYAEFTRQVEDSFPVGNSRIFLKTKSVFDAKSGYSVFRRL